MSAPEVRYRLKPGVLAQTALPQAILLDSASGQYAEINVVGSVILRALLDGCPRSELAARVLAEFSVAPAQAARECDEFVDGLLRQGLIEVS